jgi:hypothetical protein
MTAKWPSGLSHGVIGELFKRYPLGDVKSRVEMRKATESSGDES